MEIKNRYRSINSPDSGYQSLLFPATLFADVLIPVPITVAFFITCFLIFKATYYVICNFITPLKIICQ